MGGNALKTIASRRLPASSYFELAQRVLDKLEGAWPDSRPHLVRSYATKPDFGDMDVLVIRQGLPSDLKTALWEMFECREIVHNGPVWSCDVEGFQLDLVMTTAEGYDAACTYFAFNDAGNLIGRVARRMGFKYGHEGLRYVLRDGDYVIADLHVSGDMPAVFEFLGYDHARFQEGFRTLEDMFAFVAASPYFDPTAYALEQRNHVARARDRKRASYRAFLEWIERTSPPAGIDTGRLSREDHLRRADAAFGFGGVLQEAIDGHRRKRARRALFNGDRVRELTGRDGKALGQLMAHLRTGFEGGPDAFDAWLDASPEQDLVDDYIRAKAHETTPGMQPQ